MSIIGKWDTKELDKFAEKLKGLSEEKVQKFNEDTIKEIAARTLAKIIARTPVGEYPAGSGKIGGTLRRGWTAGKDTDPYSFILNDIDVIKKGRTYIIVLSNLINYASYVNYGHRTRNHKGWVEGQFFMEISEDEIQDELPAILEKKLNDFLGEYFNE